MSKPVGPYTPAVRAGDFIIVSGQLGLSDGAIVAGGVGAQTTQAIENLKGHLAGFGATLDDVVKTTCFLVDIDTFAQFNAAYSASFGESRPARSGAWEYYFYVDVEGHQRDPQVARALEKLRHDAAYFKVLGSYPSAR